MIYGYNSKLSTQGVDTIMDYGRELLEELKKVRNTEDVSAAKEYTLEKWHHVDSFIPLAEKATPLLHCP